MAPPAHLLKITALATILLWAPAAVQAAPMSTSEIFGQFNAVIFGNFTSTSDVEGRTIIGGNMTGGASFNIAPGLAAPSSFAGVTVYGNQTGTGSYNVNNGAGVSVLGTNAGTWNLNGGGSAWVGGSNSGNVTSAGPGASVSVGGGNTGQVNLNAGGSVFVGGSSTGQISVGGGTGNVAVIGTTTNTITLNNGGSVYAGGNTSGGNINVNGGTGSVSINASNAAQVTLNSGGTARIAGNTGNVNMNGGSLLHTGSVNGSVNLNGGATRTQVADAGITTPTAPASGVPSDFAANVRAPLTTLSSELAALTANSQTTRNGNALTFNAAPDSGGQAVFAIDSSVFAPNSTVTIQLNDATSVIINVNVDSCVSAICSLAMPSSMNFVTPTGYAERVLWNFVNATGIAFANEFGGSVLAPFATVSNQNPINGTLVAANYNGNGELHSYPYSGGLTTGGSNISPTAVPEPSSLVALSAGLAGLAWMRRRRRSRQTA